MTATGFSMFIRAIHQHCMTMCQRELCHSCPFEPWSARQGRGGRVILLYASPGIWLTSNVDGDDVYLRDTDWATLAKGGRAREVVETCLYSAGEFFITFKLATMTWGWMTVLGSIDGGDIPVHQAAVRWASRDGDLIDEYFGTWIPLSAIARTLCLVEKEPS